MFGLSLSHLLVVFVIVLLFGARRLPELGSSLGKSIRAFKKGMEGLDNEHSEEERKKLAEGDRDPAKHDRT